MPSPDEKNYAQQLHDTRSALRTLRLAVEAIRSGYRFDDSTADSKLASMEKAVGVLEREIKDLLSRAHKAV